MIEIDQELTTFVPEYLENRRLDCLMLEQLLAEGRWADIQTLGHRMKGSGGSCGFDEISEIGESLECAAQLSDADEVRSAAERLKKYLSRVAVTYV